jgi:hypothetical protein
MAFRDLFRSKRQREREARKRRRRASRQVRSALGNIHTRVDELKRKRDQDWQDAREYLKDGQQAAAARSLKACRASEILMARLDRKAWLWEQKVTSLEAGESDALMAAALKEMVDLAQIDPETIAETFDDVNVALEEQSDVDKVMEQEYRKEMQGVETEMMDQIPSLEEMTQMLVDEVAAEIGPTAEGETDSDVAKKIHEGRKRLRELMEDEQ